MKLDEDPRIRIAIAIGIANRMPGGTVCWANRRVDAANPALDVVAEVLTELEEEHHLRFGRNGMSILDGTEPAKWPATKARVSSAIYTTKQELMRMSIKGTNEPQMGRDLVYIANEAFSYLSNISKWLR
jgi:hypothetical protein